jgi:hypothetical protein
MGGIVMKWKWTSIVAAFSAFCLALTAFISKAAGPTIFTPGRPTGFHYVWPHGYPTSCNFYAETGDLTCMLRLQYTSLLQPISSHYHAQVGTVSLQCTEDPDDPKWLLITLPSNGHVDRQKFTWPSGVPVELVGDNHSTITLPEKWEVWLDKDDFDSSDRAKRRIYLFWMSCGLFLLSAVGSAFLLLYPAKPLSEPFDAARCIVLLIDHLEGPPDDINKMRRVLSMRARHGISIAEALAANAIDIRTTEGKRFWARTRRLFLDQLDFLIRTLEDGREAV